MGPSCCPPASWCKRFNVDNARLKSERFLIGWVSFPDLLRVIHHFSCSESILILTFGRCDLVLQERPMHDKLLHFHLDCFGSSVHGKHDLVRIDHGFLCSPSFRISFSNYWPDDFFVFWKFPIPAVMRSSLLNYVFWNGKKVHRIHNETSIGPCFF